MPQGQQYGAGAVRLGAGVAFQPSCLAALRIAARIGSTLTAPRLLVAEDDLVGAAVPAGTL
ncbi:hypothetical protein ACIGO6_33335 [Streptomyces sp. NPDC053750]|uniref:hypothetical protein n=1 Tax=Streptomyces sp. NPDC053750 TaxID=3365714 RepID=UPI0037D2BCD4